MAFIGFDENRRPVSSKLLGVSLLALYQSVDLFYQPLGPASIAASATDYAGNTATSTKAITVIATPESTASDINRAYDLGWITNKTVKNSLIKQVQGIIKLEKRIETIIERLPNGKKVAKRIERIEKRIDKALARLITPQLKLYLKRGLINNQAYQIIKNDIEWIINH